MQARWIVLAALAAAVVLTSVASAGADAPKQRVQIDMKSSPSDTFVLAPLQAGALERDTGTHGCTAEPSKSEVLRDGQQGWPLGVPRLGVHRQARDARAAFQVHLDRGRRPVQHRNGHLEGRARDGPVLAGHGRGAERPGRDPQNGRGALPGLPHLAVANCTRRAARACVPPVRSSATPPSHTSSTCRYSVRLPASAALRAVAHLKRT